MENLVHMTLPSLRTRSPTTLMTLRCSPAIKYRRMVSTLTSTVTKRWMPSIRKNKGLLIQLFARISLIRFIKFTSRGSHSLHCIVRLTCTWSKRVHTTIYQHLKVLWKQLTSGNGGVTEATVQHSMNCNLVISNISVVCEK